MKNRFLKYALSVVVLCVASVACDDALEMTPKYEENFIQSNKSPEYYANLREYKKSDHAVAFGWYGNWSGVGANLANSMAGLPDSVDFVSMWGGWKNPTEAQLKDLHFVQQVKGTRALVCFIAHEIGAQLTPPDLVPNDGEDANDARRAYWGWLKDQPETIEPAIRKYANAICDTIDKYGYDGFDLDWEPSYAQPGGSGSMDLVREFRISMFLDELSKRLGPKSGTGRLLCIDGEPHHREIKPELGKIFDYFIIQAYNCSGASDLDRRLKQVTDHYDGTLTHEECAKMFLVTENFESFSANGGNTNFYGYDGIKTYSLQGMAEWNPIIDGVQYRKGGIGTFHMEYEYTLPGKIGTYPYLRRGIQTMNPVVE